jgi:hypothetical protein
MEGVFLATLDKILVADDPEDRLIDIFVRVAGGMIEKFFFIFIGRP